MAFSLSQISQAKSFLSPFPAAKVLKSMVLHELKAEAAFQKKLAQKWLRSQQNKISDLKNPKYTPIGWHPQFDRKSVRSWLYFNFDLQLLRQLKENKNFSGESIFVR